MTAASRSLATALWGARFASGLLPQSYTTNRDTTAASDPPICPSVRTIGRDDATRAKARFPQWLNFRVFQHYPSTPDVSGLVRYPPN
jgi:hypothetical protein